MGFDIMLNFKQPYLAKSVREFWQRWHISLSTWFRDYVYISLGGNRVVKWRWYYNLFITFLVSGLWHGANWTFVIWGAIHGFYLIFAIWTFKFREGVNLRLGISKFPGLHKLTQVLMTFVLVYISWIFFRANNVGEALMILKNHFVFDGAQTVNLFRIRADLLLSFIGIAVLLLIDFLEEGYQLSVRLNRLPRVYKWSLLVVFVGIIFSLAVWNETDFLYFQF
ncbi:MAG: MBOAT family protein, partial [Bacteroidales bacterium]|nr:MBOAT family protein [Bacteroidales bacterium]